LIEETLMRTTTSLLLCSAVAACAPVGGPGELQPDAGGSSDRACDNPQQLVQRLTIRSSSDVNALPRNCWELKAALTLSGPDVTNLDMLGDLRTVASLELDGTGLTKFNSMSPIDVTGDIKIHDNPHLADLANVRPQTATSLVVKNNAALTNLGGLSALTGVTGPVTIDTNAKLETVDLSKATKLVGALSVSNNAALTTLKLDALTSVYDLTLSNNATLTKISSLAALRFIHGTLTIQENDQLTGLNAMSGAMTSIDNSVVISDNPVLSNLGQLTHVGVIVGSVWVIGNPKLDYCEAQPFTCCVPIGGALTISDNLGTSCQTPPWCWAKNNSCPFNNRRL
jgi:hypothetical protein